MIVPFCIDLHLSKLVYHCSVFSDPALIAIQSNCFVNLFDTSDELASMFVEREEKKFAINFSSFVEIAAWLLSDQNSFSECLEFFEHIVHVGQALDFVGCHPVHFLGH